MCFIPRNGRSEGRDYIRRGKRWWCIAPLSSNAAAAGLSLLLKAHERLQRGADSEQPGCLGAAVMAQWASKPPTCHSGEVMEEDA